MIAPKARKSPARTRSTEVESAEASRVQISGRAVRIVRIDSLPPRQSGVAKSSSGRARITYVPGEIAHFDFGGHRYALVSDGASAVDAAGVVDTSGVGASMGHASGLGAISADASAFDRKLAEEVAACARSAAGAGIAAHAEAAVDAGTGNAGAAIGAATGASAAGAATGTAPGVSVPGNAVVSPDVPAALTNRELQICQLICMGYLTKQVAARLKLSEFTVRSYLKSVYCKLSVRSRGAMVYRFTQCFLNAPDLSRDPRREDG
jgi:DNA-binding CsgD family transcriptional regulator